MKMKRGPVRKIVLAPIRIILDRDRISCLNYNKGYQRFYITAENNSDRDQKKFKDLGRISPVKLDMKRFTANLIPGIKIAFIIDKTFLALLILK